jgi:hypothetical protein
MANQREGFARGRNADLSSPGQTIGWDVARLGRPHHGFHFVHILRHGVVFSARDLWRDREFKRAPRDRCSP